LSFVVNVNINSSFWGPTTSGWYNLQFPPSALVTAEPAIRVDAEGTVNYKRRNFPRQIIETFAVNKYISKSKT
jgi:hypothetical protein